MAPEKPSRPDAGTADGPDRPRPPSPPKSGAVITACSRSRPTTPRSTRTPMRHLWVLTFGSLLSFATLAASQFLFTKSSPWFWPVLPPLALVTADYLISIYLDGFSKDFDIKAHRRLVRRWRPAIKPSVDVFLPVCGEPIEVLHNTWTHVRYHRRLRGRGGRVRPRRRGGPRGRGDGPALRLRLRRPPQPRLVQEGRQPAPRLRPDPRRAHPDPRRRLRTALRPARRAAPAHGRREDRHRPVPAVLPRQRPAELDRARQPAPSRSSSTGPSRPPARTRTAPSAWVPAPSTGGPPSSRSAASR